MTVVAVVALAVGVQVGAVGTDVAGALARFRAGDCGGVVAMLAGRLTPDPDGSDAGHVLLAMCYLQLGRPEEGVQAAREGLGVHPKSGLLQRILGQQLFREDPTNREAGAMLEGAIAALPGDPESRHFFAQWAFMNNRDQDCVQREQEALQATGLSPAALLQMHTLIGLCEGRSGDPDLARAAFEAARRVNLSLPLLDARAAYRYARFLADQADTEQLAAILGEILTHAPRFGPALLERAKLHRQEGRPSDAIEAANLALAGEGNDAASIREAHIVLARSYFMLGQRERAAEEQAWVDRHPVSPPR